MLIINQKGMGLLEVLVALLILAVAVLGFSALQMRAIQATDETLTRSDAMVVIRNISEDLRLLPTAAQKKVYKDNIGTATKPANQCDEVPPPKSSALPTSFGKEYGCSPEDRAEYSAYQVTKLANDSNITVAATDCPGSGSNNIQKMCIIASWNETAADMKGANNSCTDNKGTYQKNASCIIMETY